MFDNRSSLIGGGHALGLTYCPWRAGDAGTTGWQAGRWRCNSDITFLRGRAYVH
jgi:hypothetical protein